MCEGLCKVCVCVFSGHSYASVSFLGPQIKAGNVPCMDAWASLGFPAAWGEVTLLLHCLWLEGLHGTLEEILGLNSMCLCQVGCRSEDCSGLAHSGSAKPTAASSPTTLLWQGGSWGEEVVCIQGVRVIKLPLP